jgi:hypothetical protein
MGRGGLLHEYAAEHISWRVGWRLAVMWVSHSRVHGMNTSFSENRRGPTNCTSSRVGLSSSHVEELRCELIAVGGGKRRGAGLGRGRIIYIGIFGQQREKKERPQWGIQSRADKISHLLDGGYSECGSGVGKTDIAAGPHICRLIDPPLQARFTRRWPSCQGSRATTATAWGGRRAGL